MSEMDSARRIVDALSGSGGALGLRYGDVVSTDPLAVSVNGATVWPARACRCQAGDRVVMLALQGAQWVAIGVVGPADLCVEGDLYLPNAKSIYGTNSNGEPKYVFEPRNASDNCAINYLGYAESNSSTEIYGDTIYLVSNNGVSLNGKYLPDGNVTGILVTNSSDVTTTSTTTIGTLTHTSKTGHVLIVANMILATSRYTSSMQVYGQNTQFINRRTNITSPTRIDGMAHAYPSRGAAITYTLRMTSQDTSTTATFKSYNTAELFVLDI